MLIMGYGLNVAGGLGQVCTIVIFTANIFSINPPLQIWRRNPLLGAAVLFWGSQEGIFHFGYLGGGMRHHRHNIISSNLTMRNQNIRLNPQPNN
jgi:hypothetical protein